jgi:hypothetical protein
MTGMQAERMAGGDIQEKRVVHRVSVLGDRQPELRPLD